LKDAQAVADLLRSKYGFKQVDLVPNATRQDILSVLNRLRRDLKPTDNLLIYYAGHGSIDSETQRGYWLPADAERRSPAQWVSNEDITNELRAMQAKHVVVVADSCYSGTLARSEDTVRMRTGGQEEWIQRMAARRSRTVLASGSLEPVLDRGGGIHSVFAKAFLEVLRENDKVTDLDALFDRIKRLVILNADQTPLYQDIRLAGHEDGDFILVPR
jgi:uncharacterized caspase-like protein